ncbi:hypothetical protein [Amycolatopsis sp. MtRt-6]|uniref:hypothetical protein n=1 Tax=Amycolatopsis sp. MtRt-6 TaxID=2792782 RepID=UPI001A8E473A|nr:hypothetical protein [Amycolatopsis sp. MtRt-6]
MTNRVELAARQQLRNPLELSESAHPVSCAPLEAAAAAANAAHRATEVRLAARAFNQWAHTAHADIGFAPGGEPAARVTLTAGPLPLSGLLAYCRAC